MVTFIRFYPCLFRKDKPFNIESFRWIFAYSYFALNVFFKYKTSKNTLKNVNKRKKRDLNKKRNKRLLHL